MDYTQALGWIEEQEGGKEIAEAVRSHVGGLNRESQSWRQKYKGVTAENTQLSEQASTYQNDTDSLRGTIKTLETDLSAAKKEAETAKTKLTDFETNLGTEQSKVSETKKTLDTANARIQELETAINEKVTNLTTLETQNKDLTKALVLNDVATATGAVPAVLKRLITEQHNLAVENGQAFVVEGETRTGLREYADANWKEFVPALFQQTNPTSTRIPSGSPQSKSEQRRDPVKRALNAVYGSAPAAKTA